MLRLFQYNKGYTNLNIAPTLCYMLQDGAAILREMIELYPYLSICSCTLSLLKDFLSIYDRIYHIYVYIKYSYMLRLFQYIKGCIYIYPYISICLRICLFYLLSFSLSPVRGFSLLFSLYEGIYFTQRETRTLKENAVHWCTIFIVCIVYSLYKKVRYFFREAAKK